MREQVRFIASLVVMSLMIVSEAMGQQYQWQPLGTADCGGQDRYCSAGRDPEPEQCNRQNVGLSAVCWGRSYFNSAYPPTPGDCQGERNWCTYKLVPASNCSGGGHPGLLYRCTRVE
jgi:hypothetical protein